MADSSNIIHVLIYLYGLLTGMVIERILLQEKDKKRKALGALGVTEEPEEVKPLSKTNQGDCLTCWCNSCEKLNDCKAHLYGEQPDGIRPYPCVGCLDGKRFNPTKHSPICNNYKEIGK